MINTESKSISTCIWWSELKVWSLKSCAALKIPIMRVIGEKRASVRLSGEIKVEGWRNWKGHVPWVVSELERCYRSLLLLMWSDSSRLTLFPSVGGRWSGHHGYYPPCSHGGSVLIYGCSSSATLSIYL